MSLPIDPVYAVTVTIDNPLGATSATSVFGRVYGEILYYLFVFGFIFYIFALLIGVYFLMSSAGNPKRLSIAKKIFIYSTIGFIIIVAARGIFVFFIQIFT